MNIYQLSEQYQMLLEMAGEEPDNARLQEMLDGMGERIGDKAENTMKVVRSLEAEAKAIKDEEDRLRQRRTMLEKNAEYLKRNIETVMNQLGIDKIKGTIFTISLQKNSPKVVVLDEFNIPEKYFHTPEPVKQLQKKEIIEAWKNGAVIPGVEVVQEKSLRVR